MKKITFPALIIACALIVSSCSSTYYYTAVNVEEEDMVKANNGDFLFENDSLWIAYCFKGEDAPIQITVFNKLDVPLYVDWDKSALIIDNTAYPYNNGQAVQLGTSESTSYPDLFGYGTHTKTVTNSVIELPKSVSFIPPKSMKPHKTLRLYARFDNIKNKEYTRATMVSKDNETVQIKRINYNMENTPLRFGSYLTVYTTPEKPQSYISNFYVTHLIKTKVKPHNLPSDMGERGDMFYQCKEANNTGWEVLGSVGIVAGVAAIEILASPNYNN